MLYGYDTDNCLNLKSPPPLKNKSLIVFNIESCFYGMEETIFIQVKNWAERQ